MGDSYKSTGPVMSSESEQDSPSDIVHTSPFTLPLPPSSCPWCSVPLEAFVPRLIIQGLPDSKHLGVVKRDARKTNKSTEYSATQV